MKSFLRIRTRGAVARTCAIAFVAGLLTFSAQADPWDKKTTLTVDQTIQIRDTVLEPGQYVLKLADSSSNRHVVQIFNGDQSRIIDTVLAVPNYRMQPTGRSQFTFWETPAGSARAMRAWFYPGDNMGQEFPYPKQLKQLAMARTETTILTDRTPVVEREETETVTAPAAEPEPAPAPEARYAESEEPVQMAQNTPPPAPVTPDAATSQPQPEPPRELPKTASPYPLTGLAGMSLIALYGMLRLKRSS